MHVCAFTRLLSHTHSSSTQLAEILRHLPPAPLRQPQKIPNGHNGGYTSKTNKSTKKYNIRFSGMQFNAIFVSWKCSSKSSHLQIRTTQIKPYVITTDKATEQLMKALLKHILKNLIEFWILFLKFTIQETIVCISIYFQVIKKFSLQFKLAESDYTFSEKAHHQIHIFTRGISNIQKS